MRYLDPVAVIIGGVSAVAALAVGVAAPASLGIGAVALAIAEAGRVRSAWRGEASPHDAGPVLPDAPLHPQEEAWMRRADGAVFAIRRSIGLLDAGPLRDRLDGVTTDAQRVLDDLRRLAGQVTATRAASGQVDMAQLSTDLDRLTTVLERSDDPEMAHDVQRSLEAVREQLRIGHRVAAARRALQARVESGALGLQQLAAQVGEMTALAPPGGGVWQHGERIDELTTQLEALRAGLSDAGAMSHRALGAIDPEAIDPEAIDPEAIDLEAIDLEGGHDDPVDA